MRLLSLASALLLLQPVTAAASIHAWSFDSSEDQVKNGPEPDGSTESPATGPNRMVYDDVAGTVTYTLTWKDLQGDVTVLWAPATDSGRTVWVSCSVSKSGAHPLF